MSNGFFRWLNDRICNELIDEVFRNAFLLKTNVDSHHRVRSTGPACTIFRRAQPCDEIWTSPDRSQYDPVPRGTVSGSCSTWNIVESASHGKSHSHCKSEGRCRQNDNRYQPRRFDRGRRYAYPPDRSGSSVQCGFGFGYSERDV